MRAASKLKEPNVTAGGNFLVPPHLRSRSRLRAHLIEELPGWQFWLDGTAKLVRESAHDRTVLLNDEEILEHIEHFVTEWVRDLGDDAEGLFRPMMQRFPKNFMSDVEYDAAGPFNLASQLPVVSWEHLREIFDKRNAWPSPMLMQLLGAYGMSVLERRRGAKGDPRRPFAVEHVVNDLGPFVSGQSRAGERVYPGLDGDPNVPIEMARKTPVTLELAAEVAIFVGAPGEEDVEYDGKPDGPRRSADELDTAATAVEQVVRLIRKRLPTDDGK